MPNSPPLTPLQKARLRKLEPRLRDLAKRGEYNEAKRVAIELQQLLRPTGHHTRLMQAKNWVYEAAMEADQLSTAVRGFEGVRQIMSSRTRVHLEAIALLAICYLRQQQIANAEPLMAEAIRNTRNIRSEKRRRQLSHRIIRRFKEESVLAALHDEAPIEFDLDEVQQDAGRIISTKTEDQIYADVGAVVPRKASSIFVRVDEFTQKQLPPVEQKSSIPASRDTVDSTELGRTVLSAAQRVIWRSLCDPQNDVYRIWYEEGLRGLLDRKVLTAAVVASLSGIQVGIYVLMVSTTALILKVGLDVFCEVWQPEGIMIDPSER